ncbi:MAG TPA: PP2C family serine/threonine-protein phosphatase [Ktedonobacterales bacterium]
MGQSVILLSRCGAVVLMAFALLIGCSSPPQGVRRQSSAPTPTATPQPSPLPVGNGCPDSEGKAPALVTLEAYSFHPGVTVGFDGTGFQPGEGVDVRLGNLKSDPTSQADQELTTAHTNNGGDLTGTAHVPMMTPGTYHLYFVGEQCTPPITVKIILLPFTPWVVLDNYAPPPHYALGFRGQQFAPNEVVQIYLNDQNSQPVAQMTADNSGQFAANQVWNIGDLTGDNTLIFVGTVSKMVVSVQFTVVPQQPALRAAAAFAPASRPTGGLSAGRLAANAGAAERAYLSSALAFLNIDPMMFVLGFLGIWFLLCILLAGVLSVERWPKLRRLNWPVKKLSAMYHLRRPISKSLPEAGRWLKTQQRKLPTPGMHTSAKTERGQGHVDREKEDSFLAITGIRQAPGQPQPFALLIIADSMGHYANGQSAGRRTIQTLFQSLLPGLLEEEIPDDDLLSRLENALQGANRLLYWQNQRENANVSCSVTAALVAGSEARICNIGNSRAYLLPAQAALRRVTTDHSIVERSVAAGMTRHDNADSDLRRSRLYRSLGQHPDARIDTFRLPISAGDHLLLCSNGLWEVLADAEIETALRQSPDVTPATNKLIEQAKARGSFDHMTVTMMRCVEAAPASMQPGIDHISSGSSHLSRQHIA